jgi:hypothetical protein
MHPKLKSALQYLAALGFTVVLVWLSLRSLHVSDGQDKSTFIWETWQRSSKIYLLLMAVALMISHSIRAERWRLLLEPTGHKVGLGNSFLSLMVGYLINLVIPRGGEVSRCYNLYKLEKTPVEVSIGTVVVERIIDVICLLVIVVTSFVVEWSRLKKFMATLNFETDRFSSPWIWAIPMALVIFIATAIILLRRNEKLNELFEGFKVGLFAVFRLKSKWMFFNYTLIIWLLYFLMSYFVMKAFPETSSLGFSAVLTLFAVGALAMAAPLPGGAGSYHTLVPLGLVMLYNLKQADAIAFVFIFHAWQTLIAMVVGLASIIISYGLIRWKIQQAK